MSKTPTYQPGDRVQARRYVARILPPLAGRTGTVKRTEGRPDPHVPGVIVEVAWDGLGLRLGHRPSHLMKEARS